MSSLLPGEVIAPPEPARESWLSRNWRRAAAVGLIPLAVIATGCSDDDVDPATERDLDTLSVGSLTYQHELIDGTVVETSYSTDYELDEWKITEPKTINFSLRVVPDEPDGEPSSENPPAVLVEHVHADVSLEANKQGLDGLGQDSMDDSIHGGDQPGFLVREDAPYSDVFAIEGFSESLISGWGFATSGSGASEVTQERLTENNLRDAGVVGNELSFIYDIVIQDAETGLYYKGGVIVDQIFVPTKAYVDKVTATTVPTE